MDNIIFNGQVLEMSTSENNDLRVKFLICPLDIVNANNTGIKEEDISDSEKIGLKGKAVVTKVVRRGKDDYDFDGHNMSIVTKVDKDGNVKKEYNFDTTAVGYHEDVYIEEIEINGLKQKCIVADAIIWERYPKVIEVIKKLGTSLRTSWEIFYKDCYYENGKKWIKNLNWWGNCMLGRNVIPAYKISGALEISEEDTQEIDFANATMEDLSISLDNSNIDLNNSNKGGMKMAEKIENSSLTDEDLRSRIISAIYATEGDGRYYYGALVYPYDYVAYAKLQSQNSKREDYVKFTFTVNSDDTVSITSQEDVSMVFVPKTEYDAAISEVESKITEKEAEISTKNEEIIRLGGVIKTHEATIAEKESEISELKPFKEQIEQAQEEAKEAEIAQKKKELKEKALKSKYITEEEIETSEEIKEAIENLDEKSLNSIIGQRVIEYASKITSEGEDPEVETSESHKKNIKVETNLNNYTYKEDNPIFKFISR